MILLEHYTFLALDISRLNLPFHLWHFHFSISTPWGLFVMLKKTFTFPHVRYFFCSTKGNKMYMKYSLGNKSQTKNLYFSFFCHSTTQSRKNMICVSLYGKKSRLKLQSRKKSKLKFTLFGNSKGWALFSYRENIFFMFGKWTRGKI